MLPQHLGGVVDPNFLVHGTNNISIVDMSIWPLVSIYYAEPSHLRVLTQYKATYGAPNCDTIWVCVMRSFIDLELI